MRINLVVVGPVRYTRRKVNLSTDAWYFWIHFITNYTNTSHIECSVLRDAKSNTTFNNGSLGSRIDEERSEMR